jgi:hypothetical protein
MNDLLSLARRSSSEPEGGKEEEGERKGGRGKGRGRKGEKVFENNFLPC